MNDIMVDLLQYPCVFICHPYYGDSSWEMTKNIHSAREFSRMVLKHGAIPVAPYLEIFSTDGSDIPDAAWAIFPMKMMSMCDAVLVCGSWYTEQSSPECVALLQCAEDSDMVILHSITHLDIFIEEYRKNLKILDEVDGVLDRYEDMVGEDDDEEEDDHVNGNV